MRMNVARHMEAGALNPGQMEIVSAVLDECQCWEEPTISLIQGPPGTGKSRVIGNLVLELMRLGHKSKERMRVLVCASSNTAVDVIVKNLMKLQQRKGKRWGISSFWKYFFNNILIFFLLKLQTSGSSWYARALEARSTRSAPRCL